MSGGDYKLFIDDEKSTVINKAPSPKGSWLVSATNTTSSSVATVSTTHAPTISSTSSLESAIRDGASNVTVIKKEEVEIRKPIDIYGDVVQPEEMIEKKVKLDMQLENDKTKPPPPPEKEIHYFSLPSSSSKSDDNSSSSSPSDSQASSSEGLHIVTDASVRASDISEEKPHFTSVTEDGQLTAEYEELHQRVVVLRVIALILVLVCSFVIAVFFSFTNFLIFVPCTLLLLACVGWIGTTRKNRMLVNFFWVGVAVWVVCFAAIMLLYTLVTQFHSTAVSRCNNTQFALSYDRIPKRCQKSPETCVVTCVHEVSKHLSIEAVVLTLMVIPVMSIVVHIGRGVALLLPATVVDFVPSDSDDDDDDEHTDSLTDKDGKGKLKQA